MKITVARDSMQKAVSTLSAVASTRNTMPILANILLDAQEGEIRLAATDLEVGVRLTVEGTVHETGSITIPARKLAEVVRELPPEDLQLETSGKQQILLECGRASYRMFGISPEEFPTLSALGDEFFTMDTGLIRRMIGRVSFAASTTESRYFLNGVYFHLSPEWIRTVATDGYRLAQMTHSVAGLVKKEMGVIVPIKAVDEISKTFTEDEDLKIALQDNQILFGTERATLASRLVEGEYPNYGRLIPQDNPIRLTVNTEALLAAVRRVDLFANPKTHAIRLDAKEGVLTVSASSPDFGEGKEELDAACTEPIQVGFNARYVMDVLRASSESDEVCLELRDAQSATVLRPVGDDTYLGLIMPVRME